MYDDLIDTMKDILPDFAFVAALKSKMMEEKPNNKEESTKDLEEPKTFCNAWDHQNKESREKWRQAIRKELNDMIRRGVFRKVKRSTMPNRKRCMKHKWVFKVNRNGIYCARLVACG